MNEIMLFLLDKVILSVFIGVIASGIFFVILSRFKPKLEISPNISKGKSTLDGRTIYRVKVLNKTKYPLIDIKAQLHIFKTYQSDGGEIWKSKSIELKRNDPIVIDKYDNKDQDVKYAYRFLTYENLDEIWNDDTIQFLKFRIICKNVESGFGYFFEKDYRVKKQTIINGDFAKGDTFNILER